VPVVIVLNKVDRLKAAHIAEQMSGAAKLAAGPKARAAGTRFRADHPEADWIENFRALHPVSAKTGDGIRALRDELVALLPEGPLYFPQEQRSDLSVEMQIAELVREKALWLTRDEVPHAISVEVESIEEKTVTAAILVETESQKQIMVGKSGAMIKDIGTRARPEIEEILGHSVFLELRVKVRPKWRRDAATLERLGL
jgi:GTP-binding protein Era